MSADGGSWFILEALRRMSASARAEIGSVACSPPAMLSEVAGR